jgi:hypothetical protein
MAFPRLQSFGDGPERLSRARRARIFADGVRLPKRINENFEQ